MRISTALIASAFATMASAQVYFTTETLPSTLSIGTGYKLSWVDGAGDSTVTIYLAQGPSTNVVPVMPVAAGQPHNGSYTFTPTNSIPNGTYAFKIQDDSNPNNINYSNMFDIVTSTPGALSSLSSSAPATTSMSSSSAASASSSVSSSASMTSSMTDSSSSMSASTGSSTAAATTTTSSGTESTTATQSSSISTVTAHSAGDALKVGGGLLAVVAAAMIAM